MAKFRPLNHKPNDLESKKGFTLFEIVIALGVLAIGILGVLALFPVGLDAQKRSLDYSVVNTLAQWKMGDIMYRSSAVTFPNPDNSVADTATWNAIGNIPSSGTPEFFSDDSRLGGRDPYSRYSWFYSTTKIYSGILLRLYRVDLRIYNLEDQNIPVERFVSYVEIPEET